jgi:hypothetical protein
MEFVVLVKSLFVGLLVALWDIILTVLGFALSSVHLLHVETPRLEGLLVGVLFAWLYVHRERHPLLRSLGAPMKLILDVLDAAWDNLGDFMGGIKDAVTGWIQSCSTWVKAIGMRMWGSVIGSLVSARDKLRSWDKK